MNFKKETMRQLRMRHLNFPLDAKEFEETMEDFGKAIAVATAMSVNEWKKTSKDGETIRFTMLDEVVDVEVTNTGGTFVTEIICNSALQKSMKSGDDFIPKNDDRVKVDPAEIASVDAELEQF